MATGAANGASSTHDQPIIWQAEMAADSRPVTGYTLTSGNDKPERDPRTWTFTGSMDGQHWTDLDKREEQPPFPQRQTEMSFHVNDNRTAFRFYRLTILKNQGATQTQLSEIAFDTLTDAEKSVTNYRRSLDLATATARTEFTRDGVRQVREVFASRPAGVVVLRWTADKPGAVGGVIRLRGAHAEKTAAEGTMLSFKGKLGNGLDYESAAQVIVRGGTAQADGSEIVIKNSDEALILLAAGTDYVPDYAKHNKSGEDPHARVMAQLQAAAAKPYETLRAEQQQDFQLDLQPRRARPGQIHARATGPAHRQTQGRSRQPPWTRNWRRSFSSTAVTC